MRVDKIKVVVDEVGGNPYRPLYVESDTVKVKYHLTAEEVREAIEAWLDDKGYDLSSVEVEEVVIETKTNVSVATHSTFELVLTTDE